MAKEKWWKSEPAWVLMDPILARSKRKLAEAGFFLQQLKSTKGGEPEFGYYLSAFLSAVRSTSLVLQADLRGRFGVRFDAWWESAKASLPPMRVPFSVIVELRNQALKCGEMLPSMMVTIHLDHPDIEEMTITYDLSEGKVAVSNEVITFRECNSGPCIEGEELQEEEALSRAMPWIQEILCSLNESTPAFKVSSVMYHLEQNGNAMTFTELAEGFSDHVAIMTRDKGHR